MIESSKPAYMVLPSIYGKTPNAVVYPKFSRGVYSVNGQEGFSNGLVIESEQQTLAFQRDDGQLPARIVTAVSAKLDAEIAIPFECSLGVVHEKRPPKRFHWFVVSKDMPTMIHITAYKEVYPSDKPIELICRLYSDTSTEVTEKSFAFDSLEDLPQEMSVDDIFDLSNIDSFGYVSVFSHYGGLFLFSSLRKGNALTLEHSF